MQFLKIFYDKTFLKFIIVGVINTIVGAGVMFALYNIFHFSYWVSSIMNYVTEVIYFIINIAVCLFIAYSLAKPFAVYLLSGYSVSVQENTAMFTGMVIFTGLNYLSQRFIVFSKIQL